ncbi:hypothetical protein, partial [Novacetimonas maltaceti]
KTRLLHIAIPSINAEEIESYRRPQNQGVFRTLHLFHVRKNSSSGKSYIAKNFSNLEGIFQSVALCNHAPYRASPWTEEFLPTGPGTAGKCVECFPAFAIPVRMPLALRALFRSMLVITDAR